VNVKKTFAPAPNGQQFAKTGRSFLCDKDCQLLAAGWRLFPVSPTNKTDRHNLAEILLQVALNTIPLTLTLTKSDMVVFYVSFDIKLFAFW
jgi:hypothetical protein